tara:strand:- start:18 stop:995 length:978 start_codon:yes stop_codon:yes gene_type:complete
MKQIICKQILDEANLKELEGNFLSDKYIKYHITEDTKIVNEKGEPIAVFKKNAVHKDILDKVRPSFRKSIRMSNNRATAAGPLPDLKRGDKFEGLTVGVVEKNRFFPLVNGKLSKSPKGRAVASSIIGFSDRYPRIPYCRRTIFTQKNWLHYNNCLPYIKEVDNFFKKYLPERYKIQKKMCEKTSKDFVIKDTAFSTVTVNKNFRTASHYDAGDLKEGFGNLGVLSLGEYEGSITVIPKYGIGLDLKDGDLALFDVHELHGNTELKKKGWYERISVVCYYREKMIYCGNAEYELNRAKTNTKKVATEEELRKGNAIRNEILSCAE